MATFEGDNLTCVRGERVVFEGLSFAVEAGGALVLRGPNGSGKSSLLRLMSGLLRPFAGRIRWRGEPVDEDANAHRRRLRYLAHANAVKPALTVGDDLSFWTVWRGGGEAEGAGGALGHFGLAALADMPCRYLSSGQARRLALARVAAAPAPLWLLDEPAVGLDEASIDALEAAIAAHRSSGGIAVVATHQPIALDGATELRLGDGGGA